MAGICIAISGRDPVRFVGAALVLLLLFVPGTFAQDESCWFDGVSREQCCGEQFGPEGNQACWNADYTFERCCGLPPPVPSPPVDWDAEPHSYPECVRKDIVLRHAGEHGVFADMSRYGHRGCLLNDCKLTDKFEAVDPGICARLCRELEECTHWTFGLQGGKQKCFLRKSDGGREILRGWVSGAKACTPTPLPKGFAALAIAESQGLKDCDKGKGDQCPDTLAATNTWLLAIKLLREVAEGRVDGTTMHHIEQIGADSENLVRSITGEHRPSDADFSRVVFNNRLIFNSLRDWLVQHPSVELSATDLSLPNPLRTGKLCGKTSCYEL